MGPLKTRAMTLKRSDYSETSQWATFYTADFGKINTIAKGSKRKNKKFDGPIDLLSYHHIVFLNKPSQPIKILMEYELLDSFMPLRTSLDLLTRGIYVADFLNQMTALEDKNTVLFDLALETMKQLSEIQTGRPAPISSGPAPVFPGNELMDLVLFAFETRALKSLGYMPYTRSCARCNKQITPSGPANTVTSNQVVFSARAGGAVCRKCHRTDNHVITTNPGVLSLYYNLSTGQTSDLSRLKISLFMNQNLREILNYYIASILGEPLKTALAIQPMTNSRFCYRNKETVFN
ncbi:MAG: DNA repair protein RecO [Planctomycetota bacterium]